MTWLQGPQGTVQSCVWFGLTQAHVVTTASVSFRVVTGDLLPCPSLQLCNPFPVTAPPLTPVMENLGQGRGGWGVGIKLEKTLPLMGYAGCSHQAGSWGQKWTKASGVAHRTVQMPQGEALWCLGSNPSPDNQPPPHALPCLSFPYRPADHTCLNYSFLFLLQATASAQQKLHPSFLPFYSR